MTFEEAKVCIPTSVLQRFHLDTDYTKACYLIANVDKYPFIDKQELNNIIENIVPQEGTYFLMNKDIPIALIIGEVSLGREVYTIKEIYGMLPYNSQNITKWLMARKAAVHRSHLQEFMKRSGCSTISGLIRVTHCTNLIDTFWVKSVESKLSWSDVSLYTNDFDEVIAKIAFDGIGIYGEQFSSISPELGTDGMFEKCWIRESSNPQDIYLLKRGTQGASNAGLEPYSESLYSQLAQCFSDNFVQYSLIKHHGKLASKCRLFTSPEISFVNAYYYEPNVADNADYVRVFDDLGFREDIENMLILDALTLNTDRHAGNFGFLVDSTTLKPIGAAPNFDYNLSCIPYYTTDQDLKDYLNSLTTKVGLTFISIARELLTSKTRKILISLKAFKYKNPGFDFPEERIEILNKILQRQINLILS